MVLGSASYICISLILIQVVHGFVYQFNLMDKKKIKIQKKYVVNFFFPNLGGKDEPSSFNK